MRVDKIKRIKSINNITDINMYQIDIKYNDSNDSYNHKSWIIDPEDSFLNKIYLCKIFNEANFTFYLKDLKELRHFFLISKSTLSFKTLETFYYSIRYFYQFIETKKIKIHLNEIDYNILLEYGNYSKNKNNFLRFKNFLINFRMHSNYLHKDVIEHKFPVFLSNKKINSNSFYTNDEYIQLSKLIINIINDYFKGQAPEHLFIKSSFWLIAFFTGFNLTALQYLTHESFSIIKEDNDEISYLIIGKKSRTKQGYQKVIIKLNKKDDSSSLFIKTLNKLIEISQEISKTSKSIDQNFLFLSYGYNWKTQEIIKDTYFRYTGENFSNNLFAKKYFEKYEIKNLPLSAQKIRNQFSLKFFNLTKSEEFVSKILNHSNVKTTLQHYIKFSISDEINYKFQIFQELLFKFSKNQDIDWSIYQKNLKLQDLSSPDLFSQFLNGTFDTPMGNCSNKTDTQGNICDSYINCFNCKNFSIISEKDLWKIFSFKESLLEYKKDSGFYKEHYENIVDSINLFLSNLDKDLLINLRNQYNKKGKHPFWKNSIMIKQITEDYEKTI